MAYNFASHNCGPCFTVSYFLLISQGSLTDFYDSKIMLHAHIIYLKTFVWLSTKITEYLWKNDWIITMLQIMMDAAHCIGFSDLQFFSSAVRSNVWKHNGILFRFLNHIDWIVASRKQFKYNCITSTFIKRKKSKVLKRLAVMASFCHKGSSELFCSNVTKTI